MQGLEMDTLFDYDHDCPWSRVVGWLFHWRAITPQLAMIWSVSSYGIMKGSQINLTSLKSAGGINL